MLARWGRSAHIVFISFCLLTNVIVHSMLTIGGAVSVNALTGVSVEGAAVVMPLMVTIYTVHGGLRATYLASYWHVMFIYVSTLVFAFQVYTKDSDLGSAWRMYEKLKVVGDKFPVEGNLGGSYLTVCTMPKPPTMARDSSEGLEGLMT